MIARHLAESLQRAASRYPALVVTGPRQSGKTTLCRELFGHHAYANLEKPDVRQFALEDTNGFLAQFEGPVILDEAQRAPELFSYILPLIDAEKSPGRFVLTGSQNFLLLERVSQTLAGRCAIFKLLPFSLRELAGNPVDDVLSFGSDKVERPGQLKLAKHLFTGGFPPIHDRGYAPSDWLAQYTQTYLERDVRTVLNVGDLETFERFLRLCAGRAGQLLNYSSLAADCGVSVMTAKRWLSVLKASFTVMLLPQHHQNFNKRLVKSPKLYFYDTGLLCYLLGIRSPEELATHSARGAIFEDFVVSELSKNCFNAGLEPPLFFWRDTAGHEVDLLIERPAGLFPVEVKSGATIALDMFDGLKWWQSLAGVEEGALIYGGDESYVRNGVKVRPWFYL